LNHLQSDSNVKKISSHISKKVSDRLTEIFKSDRQEFEKKWDDLKIFIIYGMLSDEKFYEKAEKFALFKNADDKYFTFDEYEKLIKDSQTDKHKNLVYLYSTDMEKQYSFTDAARKRGYDVLVMDGQLDTHFINHLETKFNNSRFVRVDSDVVDKLILKEETIDSKLSAGQQNDLSVVFRSVLPDKPIFTVSFENMNDTDNPVTITQSEFMRRMKDMSAMGGGMNFYGEMPDSYNLVVNSNHPIIVKLAEEKDKSANKDLDKIKEKIQPIKTSKEELEEANKGKKEEDVSKEEKERIDDLNRKIEDLEKKREARLKKFAEDNKLVKQLIDLALLSNNMLKGEELSSFVKRSIELM